MLKTWGRALLDVIYPRSCRVCDTPLPAEREESDLGEWLCEACADLLPRLKPPFCSMCGEAFDGAITDEFRCDNCTGRRFAFDFATSAFRATGPVRELVHQFKYTGDLSLRSLLGRLLADALNDPRLASENLRDWLLVPVPLHRTKEADREFNQSHELCLVLGAHAGLATADVLRRVRRTDTQAGLHRTERLKNLRNAFALRSGTPPEQLAGAKVLLVDDVLTTGATTHECARVLKRDGGVEKVVVITLARG